MGLPLALLFSEQTFPGTGFEIDRNKIEVLESRSSYIYRIAPSEAEAARNVRSAALERRCADR
jgi:UDP-N-acetyl-D-glucosamine dehydrogenase